MGEIGQRDLGGEGTSSGSSEELACTVRETVSVAFDKLDRLSSPRRQTFQQRLRQCIGKSTALLFGQKKLAQAKRD